MQRNHIQIHNQCMDNDAHGTANADSKASILPVLERVRSYTAFQHWEQHASAEEGAQHLLF